MVLIPIAERAFWTPHAVYEAKIMNLATPVAAETEGKS
jgi:hypothetical protein